MLKKKYPPLVRLSAIHVFPGLGIRYDKGVKQIQTRACLHPVSVVEGHSLHRVWLHFLAPCGVNQAPPPKRRTSLGLRPTRRACGTGTRRCGGGRPPCPPGRHGSDPNSLSEQFIEKLLVCIVLKLAIVHSNLICVYTRADTSTRSAVLRIRLSRPGGWQRASCHTYSI